MQNTKIKLSLHKDQSSRPSMNTLGMGYMLGCLKKSEFFDIDFHDYYLQTCRDFRATTIFAENKKIYLDFWEYPSPTYTEEVYNANFDLIIKLQARKMTFEKFLEECNKYNFLSSKTDQEKRSFFDKIIPWSFFNSKLLDPYIGKENELWNSNSKTYGFFCGKDWKCRRPGKKMILDSGLEYLYSDQEIGQKINDQQYLEKMLNSKYGIVLPGRGSWATDTKNRREIDYMMMKKPLLMTYEPYYYNPLIPNYHYIKWESNMKIADIENNFDLNFIAGNGYKWYLDNASPSGISQTFRQIIKEKLNI